MADDPPKISKRLLQTMSTYWVLIVTATLTAVATILLNTFGDKTFDSLVAVLGKKLFLQITALILCSLAYCVFLLVRKDNKKLQHRRQLYWLSGDSLPFCPRCYDDSEKRVHLFAASYNNDPKREDYECHICNHDFIARDGKDFHPKYSNFRALMRQ